MHPVFRGVRHLPESSLSMKTSSADFDSAVEILCRFAAASNAIARQSDPISGMVRYFKELKFTEMCDLFNAARLVRHTDHSRRTPRAAELLMYCDPNLPGDKLAEACAAIEVDVLDEHLEYIWRNPDEFPRDVEFISELYERAFRASFRDLDETPWSLDEVAAELDATAAVFEATKINWESAFDTWVHFVWAPPHGVDHRDAKAIRKALKKGEWPAPVSRAFEWKAKEMSRVLRHIVLWAKRAGKSEIRMPVLTGGLAPQKSESR